VGCVHQVARATRRPGGDQRADGARLPQARGCRKSARILPGPNRRPLGRRPGAILNSGTLRVGRVRSQLGGHVSNVCSDV
jgi:hypothetical protein